ncbi:restriction endonuclease [Thalassotalea sp. HSM 43]|uniref:restriction endonuclease n=1 Tax=Thalassotalea sp. HSM 43 TaxID=2552945 RepID=UPI0010806C5A|nr:restriction endonuclease [Thalassotalea sp. HSM 43]QBY03733.1 restriction endonuclease [Thalassotalea sp. HSM 43]
MAKRNDSIIDLMLVLPWWVNAILSYLSYIFFKYQIPSMHFQSAAFKSLSNGISSLAEPISLLIAFIAVVTFFKALHRKSLISRMSGNGILGFLNAFESKKDPLKNITWREFEMLVGEVYKKLGYLVYETQAGADGGVDLILKRNGEKIIVQCKQWRTQKIGVKTVRELYGVMVAESADRAIVMCSGTYTAESYVFAKGKPLDLIGGSQLREMIDSVSTNRTIETLPKLNEKNCTSCGNPMLIRIAKRGPNSGNKFWGCSTFPRCRRTEEY